MVIMGRIVVPYGVFGWVKVVPDTERLDSLLDYSTWWVGREPNWQERRVEKFKIHNDVLLIKLTGVNDRDMAFALKGQQVAVPRVSLPTPPPDEYYWSDLIGLSVTNIDGVDFGKIINVFETGANDVLVVKEQTGDAPKERLVPFTPQAIIDVSISAGTMLVDWDADF